ncbi:Spy/CpxP family protein refolding chaperone [Chromohalobacter salexigens]|uniref:Spy/CpxP family protein refolding chaperone n=1 Tax=Chromohalobacter israelensis TaxID=141390 RepID=UPI0032E8833E
MIKHKKIFAIALALSLGAASSTLFAQGMHQGFQGHGGMMSGQGGMGFGMMMGGQGGMGSGMMMGGQSGMMPCSIMSGMGAMSGILDEQQMSTMREMRQENRSAQLDRMEEMMNLHDDMMQLMQAERPDPEKIKELHGKMATLHGDMLVDRVRLHNKIQDLLTEEQREQMRGRMSGSQ